MRPGSEIPSAMVAVLDGGIPSPFDIRDVVEDRRCLIVGAARAFGPSASVTDVLSVAAEQDRYRDEEEIDRFIVIAPDHPWAMDAWQQSLPETDGFMFLSDGNLNFAKACGLLQRWAGLYLGQCTKRFLIQTDGTRIESIDIEDEIVTLDHNVPTVHVDSLRLPGGGCELEFVDTEISVGSRLSA